MSDFLLEFYSEEMPASFLEESANNIKKLFKKRFLKENINSKKRILLFYSKKNYFNFLWLKVRPRKI